MTNKKQSKQTAENIVRSIQRATRRKHSAEERIRIALERTFPAY